MADKEFAIQKIYTKDISFETPNSPKVFKLEWKPEVDFNLDTKVVYMEDNFYEVMLTVTVTVKSGNTIAYLVEAVQAGIFSLTGFSEQELMPMLGSNCPNILYPYARQIISDLVANGGFPQLVLAPVNFEALYAQHNQSLQ